MEILEETVDFIDLGDDPDVPHAIAVYSFPRKHRSTELKRIFQSPLSEWARQNDTSDFTFAGDQRMVAGSNHESIDITFIDDGPRYATMTIEMTGRTTNFNSLITSVKSIIAKYMSSNETMRSAKKVIRNYDTTRKVSRLERDSNMEYDSLTGVANVMGVPTKQYNLIRKTMGRGKRRKTNRSARVKHRK